VFFFYAKLLVLEMGEADCSPCGRRVGGLTFLVLFFLSFSCGILCGFSLEVKEAGAFVDTENFFAV